MRPRARIEREAAPPEKKKRHGQQRGEALPPSPAPSRPIATLNLCGVDLTGLAAAPPPGVTHFLGRLAHFQAALFLEMKPVAKALLLAVPPTLLQGLPAPSPSSVWRARVDAQSSITGSVSLDSGLWLRGSTELAPAAAAAAQRKLLPAQTEWPAAPGADGLPLGPPPGGFRRGRTGSPTGAPPKGSPHSRPSGRPGSPESAGAAAFGAAKTPNLAAAQALLLQTQTHLTTLLLRQCGLSAGGTLRLRREGLSSCSNLTVLDVSDNPSLRAEGCKQVALSLSSLPQLKCLGLRRTGCEGDGAALVLKALRFHRVMTLDLSHNSLGAPEEAGVGKGPIMKGLKTLVSGGGGLAVTHRPPALIRIQPKKTNITRERERDKRERENQRRRRERINMCIIEMHFFYSRPLAKTATRRCTCLWRVFRRCERTCT
jgi:hypothetical protein